MQHTPTLFLLAIASAVLCLRTPAQTFHPVPAHADVVDGHRSSSIPFGSPGFRTQILVDATHIGPNGAVLNSLSFRLDRQSSSALGPAQVPNVTIELSHTSVAIGSLSTTFATNVTGPTTVVFQGTVSVPAPQVGFAGPLPWNIVIPFTQPYSFATSQGNLLIDIVGANPGGGGLATPELDVVQVGGSATRFGTGGIGTLFKSARLSVSTGNPFHVETRLLSPGHTIDFVSRMPFTPPGVLALGTAPQPVPIDLGPLGAPMNFLYIDPIVLAPLTWVQVPNPLPFTPPAFEATVPIIVANNPALIGITLYGQSATLEPLANPLGLVLGNAIEVRIGDEFETFPMQQAYTPVHDAPTGKLMNFNAGAPAPAQPEWGAVAIRFGGQFF
ncbi:MAG TPA: hypothetical protein VFT55_04385 [Planctomycetota bacterium]|nr:hypothetical protein [Planctomycetota bacterium]